MDGYMLALWARKVLDGAKAVSALAGNASGPGGEEPGSFYDEMVGSLRGSSAALAPAVRQDAPASDGA
jgi:hypothetical protein